METHKKVIVLADHSKKSVSDAAESLRPWLEEQAQIVGWYHQLEEVVIPGEGADYLLIMGGDGLLLATARRLGNSRIPVIGVNFGKLGFLTELSIADLKTSLPAVLAGQCHVLPRMMLSCQVIREGKIIYSSLALNDGVVTRYKIGHILICQVFINGEEVLTYGGDGLIVATPVGSTAYSLSAGGPILSPQMAALLITPICAHTLTARSLVVDSLARVEIEFHSASSEEAVFIVDGQIHVTLDREDRIFITRAPHDFYIVETGNYRFFDFLREKLGWASLPIYVGTDRVGS